MSLIKNTFTRLWQPIQAVVRSASSNSPYYYSEKKAQGRLLRRFGYRDPIFAGGFLPRIETGRKLPMPEYRPINSWNAKRAMFGQNDYIDILGPDTTIHPTKILYNVPSWLRGVKGNEFQILIRRRKMLMSKNFSKLYPSKWNNLRKRIMYLYKYLNQKTRTYHDNKR